MNVQHAPTARTDSREQYSYARLHGRWLVLARLGWVALVVLTLAIYFASLPMHLAQLQTICIGTFGTVCTYLQLTPAQGEALKGFGLSPGDYAAYTLALTLANLVMCLVVSTLIVWRRPDDRMALLVALALVTFGPISATSSMSTSPSPWQVPNECLYFLAGTLFALVFLLFPSGQFVPGFTRWIFVVFVVGQVPLTFFQVAPLIPNTSVSQPSWLVFLGEGAIVAVVQLYRYRRVSSSLQRQQTKWVVFGMAIPISVLVLMSVPYLLFPVLSSPGSLYPVAYNQVSILLSLFIPLSFGFAMLRSRLWEIDVLINRTLVYGTLTASLALVYAGLVIGLQVLLHGLLIQQTNGIALVVSTLAIYFLFQPLRRRIQRIIDRRFYRSKYDAAKTVAAFSATLRHEVDLDQLREQLLAVVQETMQPTHVSLWLRPSANDEKRKPWRARPPVSSEGE
jgi:hypothetical protein